MAQFRIVTVSRLMGSGGGYVGYLAAKELGFRYVDREILLEAARKLGTDVRLLEEIDGRPSSLLKSIVRSFGMGAPEAILRRHYRSMNGISLTCRAGLCGKSRISMTPSSSVGAHFIS
jgi:hypothetical protein